MHTHHYLLFSLSFSLLASVAHAVGPGVVLAPVAAAGGKAILKKLAKKAVEKYGDDLLDSALGTFCLAAGVIDNEQAIGDLLKQVEQTQTDVLQRIKEQEHHARVRTFNDNILDDVFLMRSSMIAIMKDGEKAVDSRRNFLSKFNSSSPLDLARLLHKYLKDPSSSIIITTVDLDAEFGGSRELFSSLWADLRTVLGQLNSIRAFHFGIVEQSNLTAWLNQNVDREETDFDDAYINSITDKYIAHFDKVFPDELRRKTQEISTWLDDYLDQFSKTNSYWEHGIVENLVSSVLVKFTGVPTLTAMHAVQADIKSKLDRITTHDYLKLMTTTNDVLVVRNRSGSAKQFSKGTLNVLVIRTKTAVPVTEKQVEDMIAYLRERGAGKVRTMAEKRATTDSVETIVAICGRVCNTCPKGERNQSPGYYQSNTNIQPSADGRNHLMERLNGQGDFDCYSNHPALADLFVGVA